MGIIPPLSVRVACTQLLRIYGGVHQESGLQDQGRGRLVEDVQSPTAPFLQTPAIFSKSQTKKKTLLLVLLSLSNHLNLHPSLPLQKWLHHHHHSIASNIPSLGSLFSIWVRTKGDRDSIGREVGNRE